jgi:membrane-bound ClpP family serine protease
MRESVESISERPTVSTKPIYVISGGLILIIFLVDLAVPMGVAVGVLYIVPILLSLWDPKRKGAYLLTLVGSVLILVGYLFSPPGGSISQSLSNRALSILAVCSTAVLVLQRKALEEKREKAIAAREKALDEVKILRGFLPICSSCKKIRDDQGYWNQIEGYIRDHSEAEFSHGICPECAVKLYPEFYEEADKLGRPG